MSDTDNEGTEFTVGQLTAIVAKLKKKLARFEYRLETTIIHQKLAGKKASLAMLKAQEAIAMEKEQKEARLNMSGTTIPIGLAKKIASYTAEQLQDFDSHIIGGIEYGINVRGDVVDIDGTNLTNLTHGYNPGQSPVWSPDGKKIAFNVGTAIYIMNADGSNLTTLDSGGYDPVWSPDGTKIAFAFKGIFVVNADGSNLTRLTNFHDIYNTPVWSPDGTRIVFSYADDGTSQIYVASTDGSNQAMLSGKSLLLEIKDRDNILLFGFLACMVLIPLLVVRFLRLSGKGQISELAIGSLALGIIGLVGTLLFVPTADYLIFGHTPLNNTSVIRFGFIIFPIASVVSLTLR